MDIQYQRIIDDCSEELTAIRKWISKNPIDANIKYLVSYSVVKASGTIEFVFKQMIFDYLSVNANNRVKKYLEKHVIDSSCNPTTGAITKIVEQFDGQLAASFISIINGIREKGDLNSLVELRNDIAHGRTNNPTIINVIQYFKSGVHILNVLYGLLI